MGAPSDECLDAILAVQIAVAWAGEGRCSPPRLGWWDTDLVGEDGGGDFFARLAPRTAAWAALAAVREAARRVDARSRLALPDRDAVRTLFHLGFAIDEQLGDRLTHHKRSGRPPAQALPLPVATDQPFDRGAFEAWLGRSAYREVEGGRRVDVRGQDARARAVELAAALAPLAPRYPLPYFVADAGAP